MAQMDHLFFTLYRGFAGKGKYQKVLTHFKLTKSGTTVRVPNTFENRAAAKKIQHLLRVETSQQYEDRMQLEAQKFSVLPPIRAHHVPGPADTQTSPQM